MRKAILALLAILVLASPLAAQLRVDVGIEKPLSLGATNSEEAEDDFDDASEFVREQLWLFFPTVSAYYEWDLEVVKLAAGVRAYTFIVVGALWPNLLAELNFGPLYVDAQLGGLLFGYYALNTGGLDAGKVLIPDISVWLGLGKTRSFRIGAGFMGLYIPVLVEEADIIPYMGYIGAKFSLKP